MKMKSVLIMIVCLNAGLSISQEGDSVFSFDKHKHNVSIGYPLRQLVRLRSKSGMGPLFLKYEMALTKNLGVGASVYVHSEKSYHENSGVTYPNGDVLSYDNSVWGLGIMPKVNWHFITADLENPKARKWDLYVGLGIGYGVEHESTDYLSEYVSPPGVVDIYEDELSRTHFVATEFNAGVRFYPLQNFGAYCEVGFGASNVQLGIIYKW